MIGDTIVRSLSDVAAGNSPLLRDERSPRLETAFVTSLDLSPVYATDLVSSQQNICVQRSGYGGSRWLKVTGPTSSAAADLMAARRYVVDADGVARSPGVGSPLCLALPRAGSVQAWATGLAGARSGVVTFDTGSAQLISMSSTVSAMSPVAASGVDSANDLSAGGSTTWKFESSEPVELIIAEQKFTVTSSAISLTLYRGTNAAAATGPDLIEGTFSLVSGLSEFVGSMSGEAIWDGSTWSARGRALWPSLAALGGFEVDLGTGLAGDFLDDNASWRLDGLILN